MRSNREFRAIVAKAARSQQTHERHIASLLRRADQNPNDDYVLRDSYAKAGGRAVTICRMTDESIEQLCDRLLITTAEREAMIKHCAKLRPTGGKLPEEDRLTTLERRLRIVERQLAALSGAAPAHQVDDLDHSINDGPGHQVDEETALATGFAALASTSIEQLPLLVTEEPYPDPDYNDGPGIPEATAEQVDRAIDQIEAGDFEEVDPADSD